MQRYEEAPEGGDATADPPAKLFTPTEADFLLRAAAEYTKDDDEHEEDLRIYKICARKLRACDTNGGPDATS